MKVYYPVLSGQCFSYGNKYMHKICIFSTSFVQDCCKNKLVHLLIVRILNMFVFHLQYLLNFYEPLVEEENKLLSNYHDYYKNI